MLICPISLTAEQAQIHTGEMLRVVKAPSGAVTVTLVNSMFEFTFDPALVTQRPDVMFLNKNTVGGPAFTWLSQTGDSADGYLSSRTAKRIHADSVCLALFGVDAQGEVFVYALRGVLEHEGFASVVEVGFNDPKAEKRSSNVTDVLLNNPTSSGTLAHYASASLKAFIQHMHLKQVTLAKLSTARSLDTLERQVDLLTHVVLELAAAAGVSTHGLAQVLNAASAAPAEAQKSISRVLAYKTHVRNVAQAHGEKVKELYSATEE